MLVLQKIIFIVFLSLSAYIFSEEPVPQLNLAEFPAEAPDDGHALWSLHGHGVLIRGFWHPLASDEGVLTASPQVKSCCLKAPSKIHQQVIVKGMAPLPQFQKAATLEGIFKIEPLYNKEGEAVQYYVLEQAKEFQPPGLNRLVLILFGFAGLSFACLKFRKRMQG